MHIMFGADGIRGVVDRGVLQGIRWKNWESALAFGGWNKTRLPEY